jgi:hypothetical protein
MLKFISSVRLAVILIAALAGLAVAATLYELPNMYQSIPFRVLVIAFFVNLLTCSVRAFPRALKGLGRKAETIADQDAGWQESSLARQDFEAALKGGHYHWSGFSNEKGTWILARAHRAGLMAPHLLHVGILITLVGAFLTTYQVTGQLMLLPGETQPLPYAISERLGEGSITVSDFQTRYDDKGDLDNWVTTFDLTVNDKTVTGKTLSVNHPYKSGGLSIYQVAYNNEYVVHLSGGSEAEGDYAVPEDQKFAVGQGYASIAAMTDGVALLHLYDADGDLLGHQAFKPGDKATTTDGVTLEYIEPISATVLQFKVNRALPLVFAGFIIIVLASLLFLPGRYSEVRALIDSQGRVRAHVLNKSPYLRRKEQAKLGLAQEEE